MTGPSALYRRIYALVAEIPAGRVASYGQIARRAGCHARLVGFALAALPGGSAVPWQRVVNREGAISARREGDGGVLQRDLLEAEGVRFDHRGRIDLRRYGWSFPDPSGDPDDPSLTAR